MAERLSTEGLEGHVGCRHDLEPQVRAALRSALIALQASSNLCKD